ncbi:TPA: hypothetical protein ENX78_04165 [Candidatus Poribacteria bacterium]|nr:hypothetical protein [Candidatus Poribacteria bacterium]
MTTLILKFRFYIIALLVTLLFLGCYSTENVNITVRVDSKVDMRKYRTIAVMDFVDKSSKSANDNGKLIARMIRKQLKKSKDFQILEERNMTIESEVHENELDDLNVLVSLGNQLGVDALIVGSFEAYQRYQSIPYIVDRYSTSTGKYVPEGRTYYQKTYVFSFHAQLIDVADGKIVYEYSPRPEERPEYRSGFGLPFTDGSNDPANVRAMAVRPVTNFVLSLMPHYETERRILVK